jgi:sugar lactone lactonase YvrE
MIEPINEIRAELGEGPVWHGGELIWIDIEGRSVHVGERVFALPERVGCAWPCAQSEHLICGLESGLAFLDLASGRLEPIVDPEPEFPTTRFNDGKCDPRGRFWAGTMDMDEEQALGSLYMLDAGGNLRRQWQGVTVSNGLAWDPDGTTFYYIDSPTREVAAFDYDAESGGLTNRRVAIPIPDGEGFPDGMTIDAEGMLWIALWGGWGVVRYDPKGGERLGKIDLPVEKVTSCCFGGTNLDELYVTTARIGLGEAELAAQPHAGGVFRIDAGVPGLPTVPAVAAPGG